ncbi:heavy metal translocating P-type ATPase [Arcobacter sp. FWKO B]|uniref:heavy metal translocating P-type ATPase n=1 Tax=Arcobacter sp. FWKO B TaxID=2593672 RepID=UPI0018A3515F|nr:heavy metal translocating P-type ATPase [Arcobacter sp. FWKO B]QOG12222.1 heavy metal translocating P-type ATPase [Arcobacter sp. FWKO B]
MAEINCSHCHLKFEKEQMIPESIDDKELYFCCNGCQGVYHLLHNEGLDSFYTKLGKNTINPPKHLDENVQKFDLDSFQKRFIKKTLQGFSQIDLIIEGIHCAACVWLNEKILYSTDGIIEANINFTNYKARIVWDDSKIKLSDIILKIRSIGYDAYPYDSNIADEKATKAKRDYFMRMIVAVFGSMNIMMLGVAKYSGFFTGMDDDVKAMVHFGEFILTTPVLFYSGWVFFRGGYYGLKNKIINMDFLVASGATLTYIYSMYILFGGKGESYFDSVTMIITFVLVGKYLEVIGKKSAVDTIDKIRSSLPLDATIIKDGTKQSISVDEIKIGDILELKTGEIAPVDGTIISGNAAFDESSITGESLPIAKTIGDTILSGTINTNSLIRYQASKDFSHSTISSIVTLIEDSLTSKSEIEKKANEISKSFSATILSIAFLTFLGWYFLAPELFYAVDANRFEKAFIVMISVIVIACPCALSLATPIASLVGISELAKNGLIFKEGRFLETMAKANVLVVDKTGTITEGKLTVTNFHKHKEFDINLLYSLVSSSNHLISKAIKSYLENHTESLKFIDLEEFRTYDAKGISATYNNISLLGGNSSLLNDYNIQHLNNSNSSIFYFAIDNQLVATFDLEDIIKKDAKEVISKLKEFGLDIVMLTGDNNNVASKISSLVGIDKAYANLSPIDKATYIDDLKKSGKIVVMAGDGVNDALALSKSDIAISMGNGADITIATSDVIILDNSLQGLLKSFEISNKTYKLIKQNLGISLIYNAVTIPIAMAGYVIPLVAALSMSLSSLLVVGNSLRIKNGKK